MKLRDFRNIIVVDFEYFQPAGEKLKVICGAWSNLQTGESGETWLWGPTPPATTPYPTGSDTVLVAYAAAAEMACHLALEWEPPVNVIDLYAEYRLRNNGIPSPFPNSMLGACQAFGIPVIDGSTKDAMRNLCMQGGPYSEPDQLAILKYNRSDVVATASLLEQMESSLDVPRALLRGRHSIAVAAMETAGVPIDLEIFEQLRRNGRGIERALVERVDEAYGIYEDGHFRVELFEDYCRRHGIQWRRYPDGKLDLRDDTFEAMARLHPCLEPLRQVRKALAHLRSCNLTVGRDGRNRCGLMPFSSRTGRNQPSSSRFVFGPGAWIRGLITPPPGRALAYIDFAQQEFCIAAALSGDERMMQAYHTTDPYLAFATMAGAVPAEATKESHPQVRELYKRCALAVQYGMGEFSLGESLGIGNFRARLLIEDHRRLFVDYWKFSQSIQDAARLGSRLQTVFGWKLTPTTIQTTASLRNFPIQATGAEILRLACMAMVQRGIMVCAPLHDAVLIEAAEESIEIACQEARDLMSHASVETIGVPMRTDARMIKHGERLLEPRGLVVWQMILELLEHAGGQAS